MHRTIHCRRSHGGYFAKGSRDQVAQALRFSHIFCIFEVSTSEDFAILICQHGGYGREVSNSLYLIREFGELVFRVLC
jgi:hypothetical protein